uniref:Uncharacterized protein n=1 Tax=Brassica campestris TaxID=3711 RepID=M4E4H8_BRACM
MTSTGGGFLVLKTAVKVNCDGGIGYLYFTRIVVFALKTIAAYKYQWVSFAAEEIVSLVFYVIMFYIIRHEEKNEYFAVDDDEEEAAAIALRDDEFEL